MQASSPKTPKQNWLYISIVLMEKKYIIIWFQATWNQGARLNTGRNSATPRGQGQTASTMGVVEKTVSQNLKWNPPQYCQDQRNSYKSNSHDDYSIKGDEAEHLQVLKDFFYTKSLQQTKAL